MIQGPAGAASLAGLAASLAAPPQMAPDPRSLMAPPDIPRELLGPTQRVFFNSQGRPSTHLNIVTEHPLLPGRQTMIPMLVPGQTDIGRLLEGQPATQAQYRTASDYARAQALRGALLPTFNSIPEALSFEQQWRKDVIPQLEQRLPSLEGLMQAQP